MLSKRASGWKWYDWIIFLIVLLIALPLVVAAVNAVAPTSGAAHALHTGFHAFANFLLLVSGFLSGVAQFFNQL